MRVKVCGITSADDLRLADDAGADFAGFVLVKGSKRYVSPERLAELGQEPVRLKKVGVFVRATPREITRAIRLGKLDIVQLYHCTYRRAGIAVWHATPAGRGTIVVDAAPGAGKVGDWPKAKRLARRQQVVLAGGLTPENVAEAVAAVKPWCVDGASGTEARPGVKDPEKVKDFIRKAKQ